MRHMKRQNKIAVLLLFLGIIFLCTGLYQGGYQDTLHKAIRVCLECIGSGGKDEDHEKAADTALFCITI